MNFGGIDRFVLGTIFLSLLFGCIGCGTTKWSDTARTGTEQLLISDAIDSAVGKINFRPLGDRRVYLKTDAIETVTDNKYLTMALRQHLATSGGILCDKESDADYIIDVRAGAVGTDRDDLLVGIPALSVPTIPNAPFSGSVIPEVPFIRRTKQIGVAKIAVFAYNKETGRPIWASGNSKSESSAKNLWFAGTGPFTYGTIYDETTFAGHSMPVLLQRKKDKKKDSFADQTRYFRELPNEPSLKDKPQAKSAPTPSEPITPPQTNKMPPPPPPLPNTNTPQIPIPTLQIPLPITTTQKTESTLPIKPPILQTTYQNESPQQENELNTTNTTDDIR